jgi:hypothetical protein
MPGQLDGTVALVIGHTMTSMVAMWHNRADYE